MASSIGGYLRLSSRKRVTTETQRGLCMELAGRFSAPERCPNGVENKDFGKRLHKPEEVFLLRYYYPFAESPTRETRGIANCAAAPVSTVFED